MKNDTLINKEALFSAETQDYRMPAEPDTGDTVTVRMRTAKNGAEAIEILRSSHVDLIISDIMMPVMNGYQLCKEIKSDLELSHIPVIFLTAKNDIDSKINGL